MPKPPPAAVRTEAEREADLLQIAMWYQKGWTHFRMSEELNLKYADSGRVLTRRQVSSDVATILKRWQERAATAIDQRRAEELARIDRLEAEYWDAWERSKESAKTISRKGESVSQVLRDSDGDPRFLQGVERCIEMRIKIFGLAAPTKIKFEGSDDELISRITGELAALGLAPGRSQSPQAEPGRDEED